MSSETTRPGAAARMTADPSGRDAGGGLAGLIDVLDRVDGVPPGGRGAGRRPAAARQSGTRSGAVRTVPLRSVQPAPLARPAPAPFSPAPAPARPAPVPGRARPSLSRRAALWGAGANGEFLAWRPAAPKDRRPPVLRGLIRRLALWGAGPQGEYLAWGRRSVLPVRPAASRDLDPPVVLREMPSTPLIGPAAPSPAAALVPRGPAVATAARVVPPPSVEAAHPAPGSPEPADRVPPTGWPRQRARSTVPSTVPTARFRSSSPVAGARRARGDPLSCPVRGSPAAPRRSSPPSNWVSTSSAARASLPPPPRAPSAPG